MTTSTGIRRISLQKFISLIRVLLLTIIVLQLLAAAPNKADQPGATAAYLLIALTALYALAIGVISFHRRLKAFPERVILVSDFVFAFCAVLATDYHASPFLLYTFAPVVATGLRISFAAGAGGGLLMMVGNLTLVHIHGFGLTALRAAGDLDDLIGMSVMYLLIGGLAGYIGDMQRRVRNSIDRNAEARVELDEATGGFRKLRRELVTLKTMKDHLGAYEDEAVLAGVYLQEMSMCFGFERALVYIMSEKLPGGSVYSSRESSVAELGYENQVTAEIGLDVKVFYAQTTTVDLRVKLDRRHDLVMVDGPHSRAALVFDASEAAKIESRTLQLLVAQIDAAATSLRLRRINKSRALIGEQMLVRRDFIPDIGDQVKDCASRCRALTTETVSGDISAQVIEIESMAKGLSAQLRAGIYQLKESLR